MIQISLHIPGGMMNTLTLLVLVWVLVFTLPKVYLNNKVRQNRLICKDPDSFTYCIFVHRRHILETYDQTNFSIKKQEKWEVFSNLYNLSSQLDKAKDQSIYLYYFPFFCLLLFVALLSYQQFVIIFLSLFRTWPTR